MFGFPQKPKPAVAPESARPSLMLQEHEQRIMREQLEWLIEHRWNARVRPQFERVRAALLAMFE